MKVIRVIESRDGRGMLHEWDRGKMCIKPWRGNLEETAQSDDLGVDGKIIFKWNVRSGTVAVLVNMVMKRGIT
jgi:hypothetical protein